MSTCSYWGADYFANSGAVHGVDEPLLHYIYTDGSTELKGLTMTVKKVSWHVPPRYSPRLACLPDSRYIYKTDAETAPRVPFYVVWRKDLNSSGEALCLLVLCANHVQATSHLEDLQG